MNVKKFAQDKAKKMKYQKFLKQNKQNMYSVDDSKFKQFSVDLHKLSYDQEYSNKNKNIIKEQISVFLQNQSQNKTFLERTGLELELKKFINKLDANQEDIKQFLHKQLLFDDQLKSQDIKRLINSLSRKILTERSMNRVETLIAVKNKNKQNDYIATNATNSPYNSNSMLNTQIVSPYLTQQISKMQQKLLELQEYKNQYKQVKKIEKKQKQYIRHTLQTVYRNQLKEVYELELSDINS